MKINHDQVSISFRKSLIFNYKRSCGHRFSYLLNRFRWHYLPRLRYVSRFPSHVDIEISSVCNMHCPMCYTITSDFQQKVRKGLMDFGLFKKIIDECASEHLYSIRLSFRGEPFLHKQAIEMIAYAKNKGIKEVSCLSNILVLTPELFEEAMRAGLDWLTISFDGLGSVYEKIRKPAIFHEAYSKVKQYHAIKKRARFYHPVIKIQTIWPAISGCSQQYVKLFAPYADQISINPLVDYLHNDFDVEYVDKFICPVIYQRLTIGSDGKVLLCPNDEFCLYSIGDANQSTISDIWHGDEMSKARDIHKSFCGVEKLAPCAHCYLPRKTLPEAELIGNKKITIEQYTRRSQKIGS